jgi:hypothetical protein
MHEQTPEEYMVKLERQFRIRKVIRDALCDIAISSILTVSSGDAHIVFEAFHPTDRLPHD